MELPVTDVAYLDSTPSTNSEALSRLRAGDVGPKWIVAERQTSGRGRSGRSWQSEKGNLHASYYCALDCEAKSVSQLSLVAGVALIDAVKGVCGNNPPIGLRLKWPNDVFIEQAKLAGILVESTSLGSVHGVVVGFGVNVEVGPKIDGQETVSLTDFVSTATSRDLLALLDVQLLSAIDAWQLGHGFSRIRDYWQGSAGKVGERLTVRIREDGRVRSGAYVGLDHDGALLIRAETGKVERVTYGDVTFEE